MSVHRAFDAAAAESALESELVDILSQLSNNDTHQRPLLDGAFRPWTRFGMQGEAAISREAGRIDLNNAEDDLVKALLESQGIDQGSADVLLRNLRDYQSGEIANAALSSTTVNTLRPLKSVGELVHVPGWEGRNPNCWQDALTVYTHMSSVNPRDASPLALGILKWAEEHHIGSHPWLILGDGTSPSSQDSVAGIVIRVKLRTVGETRVSREWVGLMTADRSHPTLTMSWESSREPPQFCAQAEHHEIGS